MSALIYNMALIPQEILSLPLQLKLNEVEFAVGAQNKRASIILTCDAGVQNHTLTLPARNSFGYLQNDGSGQLRWVDIESITASVVNVNIDDDSSDGLIKIQQSGKGSACIKFRNPGGAYVLGTDQADNNLFKLSAGDNIGASDIIKFSQDALVVPKNLLMQETIKNATSGVLRLGDCNIYALNATGNLFIGSTCGNLSFTTATMNTACGKNSQKNITTGSYNTSFGNSSLQFVTTGNYNTAFGNNALNSATTGSFNVAIGNTALTNATTGNRNVAFGSGSLSNLISGERNIAIGTNAGIGVTTGTGCMLFGDEADVSNGTLINAVAIGQNAKVNDSNKIQMGNTSLTSLGVGPFTLSTKQISQLTTLPDIDTILIQPSTWVSLSSINQSLGTTSSPTFNVVTANAINAGSIGVTAVRSSVTVINNNTILTGLQSIIKAYANNNPITITLPPLSNLTSIEYKILKSDASLNKVTIVTSGNDTIDYEYNTIILSKRIDKTYIVNCGDTWVTL